MIEINPSALHHVSGGQVHLHLAMQLMIGIGLITGLYLAQKKGLNLTQLLCHVGCAASGSGPSCVCTLASSFND